MGFFDKLRKRILGKKKEPLPEIMEPEEPEPEIPSVSNEELKEQLDRMEGRIDKADVSVEEVTKPIISEIRQHDTNEQNRLNRLHSVVTASKDTILERLSELGQNWSRLETTKSDQSVSMAKKLFDKLTPKEKVLFNVLIGTGALSYEEIADKLGITPITTKNMINTLFKNKEKRELFEKNVDSSRKAKLSLSEKAEKEILERRPTKET